MLILFGCIPDKSFGHCHHADIKGLLPQMMMNHALSGNVLLGLPELPWPSQKKSYDMLKRAQQTPPGKATDMRPTIILKQGKWYNDSLLCSQLHDLLNFQGLIWTVHYLQSQYFQPMHQSVRQNRHFSLHQLGEFVMMLMHEQGGTLGQALEGWQQLVFSLSRTNSGPGFWFQNDWIPLLHGIVWYETFERSRVSQNRELWEVMISDISLQSAWLINSFLHGIGHGWALAVVAKRHQVRNYSACTSFEAHIFRSDDAQLREIEMLCGAAPTSEMAHGCAGGAFHSWTKYFAVEEQLSDWAWPCVRAYFAAPCFRTLFIEGRMPKMFGTWVAQQRGPPSDFFSFACAQLESERAALGCINGLSYFMYRSSAVGEASFDQLISCGMSEPSLSDAHANVKNALITLVHSVPNAEKNGDTLALLCSTLLQPHTSLQLYLSEKGRRRWLACVHGSLWNDVSTFIDMLGVPLLVVVEFCEQLLNIRWQPNATFKAEAARLCLRTALVDKQNANMTLNNISIYESSLFDL